VEESPSPTDDAETVTGTLTEHTRPGVVVGTIAYMSPGGAGKQSTRAAHFSFGVVLRTSGGAAAVRGPEHLGRCRK
jgi:hypothetical protein